MLKRGKTSSWIRTNKKRVGKGWALSGAIAPKRKEADIQQPQHAYVMTNPMIDGWVKVGMSFDPYSRVKQLNTGSPVDLVVAFCLELKDGQADKDFHPALRNASNSNNREWFEMSEKDAIKTMLQVFNRNLEI
jgi:hypothetical protein